MKLVVGISYYLLKQVNIVNQLSLRINDYAILVSYKSKMKKTYFTVLCIFDFSIVIF